MIDIANEHVMGLGQACREPVFLNPVTGKPSHISTLHRHVLRGARAVDGSRVKLEVIKTPRGLQTSREAIERFVNCLTNPHTTKIIALPAQRRRAIAAAKAELDQSSGE